MEYIKEQKNPLKSLYIKILTIIQIYSISIPTIFSKRRNWRDSWIMYQLIQRNWRKKKKKKTLHIYLWNNTALAAVTNTCGRVASLRIAQLDRSTLCGAGRAVRIANITLWLTRTRGVAGLASLATGSFPGQKNRREKYIYIYIHKMQSRVIS